MTGLILINDLCIPRVTACQIGGLMDIKTAAITELPFMYRKRFCIFSLHPNGNYLVHLLIYRQQNAPLKKVFQARYSQGQGWGWTGEIPPIPSLQQSHWPWVIFLPLQLFPLFTLIYLGVKMFMCSMPQRMGFQSLFGLVDTESILSVFYITLLTWLFPLTISLSMV